VLKPLAGSRAALAGRFEFKSAVGHSFRNAVQPRVTGPTISLLQDLDGYSQKVSKVRHQARHAWG
jgi:hypothetical protein